MKSKLTYILTDFPSELHRKEAHTVQLALIPILNRAREIRRNQPPEARPFADPFVELIEVNLRQFSRIANQQENTLGKRDTAGKRDL